MSYILEKKMDDVRWVQRFENYKKALMQLKNAYKLSTDRELSLLECQGVIQAFEYTFELGWKCMKDFLEYQGVKAEIYGSRDTIRESFSVGIINDGETWMDMIKSRNLTSHIYDEEVINGIIDLIFKSYLNSFIELEKKFEELKCDMV